MRSRITIARNAVHVKGRARLWEFGLAMLHPSSHRGKTMQQTPNMEIEDAELRGVVMTAQATLGHKRGYKYVIMPVAVLDAPGLSRTAKTTYATLLKYAWQDGLCFPGQKRMAADLNVSVEAISRDLRELRDYGLIRWQQRGLGRTNVYYLHDLTTVAALGMGHAMAYTRAGGQAEIEATSSSVSAYVSLPVAVGNEGQRAYSTPTRKPESASGRSPESASTRILESVPERINYNAEGLDPENKTQPQQEAVAVGKTGEVYRTASVGTMSRPDSSDAPNTTLIANLMTTGLVQQRAATLVEKYGATRVARQLEALRTRQRARPGSVSDPAGWLVRAIEHDYPAPSTAAERWQQALNAPTSVQQVGALSRRDPFVRDQTPAAAPHVERNISSTSVEMAQGGRAAVMSCVVEAGHLSHTGGGVDKAEVLRRVAGLLKPERVALVADATIMADAAAGGDAQKVTLRFARGWQAATFTAHERQVIELALADVCGRAVRMSIC